MWCVRVRLRVRDTDEDVVHKAEALGRAPLRVVPRRTDHHEGAA